MAVWVVVAIVCFTSILIAVLQALEDEKVRTPTPRVPSRDEYQLLVDGVSTRESEFTKYAVSELEKAGRHRSLTRGLQQNSDYSDPDKWPLLFEARFAYELMSAGIQAEYEHATGVGDDFRFETERAWLVELVSPQISRSAVRNTTIAENSFGSTFSQSPDSGIETTRIQDKIIEKAARSDGSPCKFPDDGRAAHMIVVDTRRFHGGHADQMDYRELVHGSKALPAKFPFHTLVPGETRPIAGVFEREHPCPRAKHLRERVHFVGFVSERSYEPGEIAAKLYTEPNPRLFASTEAAYEVFESFPLRPAVKPARPQEEED